MENVVLDSINDLIEWSGESREEVVRKMCDDCHIELKKEWDKIKIKNEANITKFYSKTIWYIYDLTRYNIEYKYMDRIKALRSKFTGKKILDFGGGIGTVSIALALNGNEVDYYDIYGKTWEYAKWRFDKYKVNVNMFTEKMFDKLGKYDAIIFYDVLEHIPYEKVKWILLKLIKEHIKEETEFIIATPSRNLDHPEIETTHITDGRDVDAFLLCIKEKSKKGDIIENKG